MKNAEITPRFTARGAYGSLPPLSGREHISDDELEDIIREANEQHAREILEELEAEHGRELERDQDRGIKGEICLRR